MRPSWDVYFSNIVAVVATRSTCLRATHGAIIVKDKQILATGYNGAPSCTPNCSDLGECFREANNIPSGQQYEKCRAVHAEANAIIQCAKHGVACKGATIYVDDVPCELCAKQILAAGITEVVFTRPSGRYCSKALNDLALLGGKVRNLEGE